MRLNLIIEHTTITRIGRVDPALLCLRETLRRLDMRLRPVLSSPAELDALLAAFHGVRG